MNYQDIKFDCKHFKGGIPCKPNKEKDVVCDGCPDYAKKEKRILIIKLGAMGDVIRTTPLVVKYREMYPDCHITWLTLSPDVLPADQIDVIFKMDFLSLYKIEGMKFDIAINLDKEEEACILLQKVSSPVKYGYIWNDGHLDCATPNAQHKIITGLYDNISKQNTKSYQQEIFEICHMEFNNEPCLLNLNTDLAQKWEMLRTLADGKRIIGLNTGCGPRWNTRLWPNESWVEFIELLQDNGFFPMVVGGPAEEPKNKMLHEKTGVYYPGCFPLEEFISMVSNIDIIVSPVSMMLHIATGLHKPIVLFNNIFNKHEFVLYGKGEIVEPSTGCDCFYGTKCKRERSCMHDLAPQTVLESLLRVANKME